MVLVRHCPLHERDQRIQLSLFLLNTDKRKLMELWGNDNTLLHLACCIGSVQIVKWLLEKGMSPSQRNKLQKCPFEIAMANAHLMEGNDVVELLSCISASGLTLNSCSHSSSSNIAKRSLEMLSSKAVSEMNIHVTKNQRLSE